MNLNALLLALSLAVGQSCPDGSCGVGIGAGVNVGRFGINAGVSIGRRPPGERLISEAMCSVEGGLGCHIGDGLVLTCSHGSKERVGYRGAMYPARVLAEIPTANGDVAVVHCDAPFTQQCSIAAVNPPPGSRIQWQGGAGVIRQHVGHISWVQGYCRFGDSGSPVFHAGKIVGVISGTTGQGDVVIGNVTGIQEVVAIARASMPRSQPPQASEPTPRLIESPDQRKEVDPEKKPETEPSSEYESLRQRIAEAQRFIDEIKALQQRPPSQEEPKAETPPIAERSPVARDVAGKEGPPEAQVASGVDWGQVGTTAAMWALGAAGLGGGAVSGAWVIYGGLAAMKLLARRLRRKGDTPAANSATVPAGSADIARELANCQQQCVAQQNETQRLREALAAAQKTGGTSSAELAELRQQLEQSRIRVADLEQRHRELVIAYRDSYKDAVDLAEAALHRKDPLRWQQFIPAWRSMVEQFHSAIREERKHASNPSVH